MKFVLTFTQRAGAGAADTISSAEAAQKLLANWAPSPSATIHQWVSRCDGNGGFSVIETDNAADLLKDLATWSPWFEFQAYPVVDILEASPLTAEALATARGVI